MLETPAHTARSFERMLRDNGFSRRDAKAITAKGFKAADFSESESTEIAEMITELKQRQGVFERKRSKYGRVKVIEEVVGTVSEAYRRVNGTSMPLLVIEGDSEDFNLGLRNAFGKSSIRVEVKTPRNSDYKYTCVIRYWSWTRRGPEPKNLTLTNRSPYGDMEIGSEQVLKSWLEKEYQQLEARNAVSRFASLVAQVERIVSKGLVPQGKLTYHKLLASNQVRINMPGRGKTDDAGRFSVVAR